MLNGIDISNWQTIKQLEDEIENGCQFVIIKASEGTTYVDTKAKSFALKCAEHGIPIFFYHFCRLTDTAEKEAEHFMRCVYNILRELPKGTKVGLALDFEINPHLIAELGGMARYLTDNFQVYPLIYCSEWLVPYIATAVNVRKYGLWVAKYSDVTPSISPWEVMAFWQYTSTPIDRDRFYGNREQLEKYQDYMLPDETKCSWCTRATCIKEEVHAGILNDRGSHFYYMYRPYSAVFLGDCLFGQRRSKGIRSKRAGVHRLLQDN